MERLIEQYEGYAIFKCDKECIKDLSKFIVTEKYRHHNSMASFFQVSDDTEKVVIEEYDLFGTNTYIYIALDINGKILGAIRVFMWNRQTMLPIEKLYGINLLEAINPDEKYHYWHVGRFAINSTAGISTLILFKRLMVLALKPIVADTHSYMVAEIDNKLLKVMNAMGFVTRQLAPPIYYLSSETIPVCSSKQGIMDFYSKYEHLCKRSDYTEG